MNEVLARKQSDRGTRAESLLKNELLIEFWEVTEKALVEKWSESQDKEERDDLWRNLRMMKNMKNYMDRMITTGRDAGKELKNITSTKNPSKLSRIIKRI